MASGGARARSGPAPDPHALRRDRPSDQAGWVVLPAGDRAGEPPQWPLYRPSKRELALWAIEWRRPQAAIWEINSLEIEVALYVRSLAKAEKSDAAVNLRTLVKQQQEALGISLPGLLRNRWRIEDVEPATAETTSRAGRSAKDRFQVVTGGAA